MMPLHTETHYVPLRQTILSSTSNEERLYDNLEKML